jgi:hypothetical protein
MFPTSLSLKDFLKWRQKLCLNLLIKEKRIARLINGKPSENRHNKTTSELLTKHEIPYSLGRSTNSPHLLQQRLSRHMDHHIAKRTRHKHMKKDLGANNPKG